MRAPSGSSRLRLLENAARSSGHGHERSGRDHREAGGHRSSRQRDERFDRREKCAHGEREHPMLFGHRSAETLCETDRPAEQPHVGGEHGEQGSSPSQRRTVCEMTDRVAGGDQDEHVGQPVREIVVDLPVLVLRPSSTASMPSRNIAQKPKLDTGRRCDQQRGASSWRKIGRERERRGGAGRDDDARDRDGIRSQSDAAPAVAPMPWATPRFWSLIRDGPRSIRLERPSSPGSERLDGRWSPVRRAGESACPDEREKLRPDLGETPVYLSVIHGQVQAVVIALGEGVAREAIRPVAVRGA